MFDEIDGQLYIGPDPQPIPKGIKGKDPDAAIRKNAIDRFLLARDRDFALEIMARMGTNYCNLMNEHPFLTFPICQTHGGAYTQGLRESCDDHPELLILLLPPDACHQFFWYAYHAIDKAGFRFKSGQKLHNFLGVEYPFAVVEVDPLSVEGSLQDAALVLKDQRHMLQLVLCDKQGRFPWEAECDLNQPVFGEFQFTEDIDMHEILMSTQLKQ